mgnify:CR=1 FL=1
MLANDSIKLFHLIAKVCLTLPFIGVFFFGSGCWFWFSLCFCGWWLCVVVVGAGVVAKVIE